MDVCAAYGIPHSTFLSWEPSDRDKAVWHEIYKRESCPSCGTRADEWDPAKGGDDDAYRAELRKCWGCSTKAGAQKAISDEMGAGVSVVLIRNH